MDYSVEREDFSSLAEQWLNLLSTSPNNTIFLTPFWHQTWWQHFPLGREMLLLSVRHNAQLVAVAPLMREGSQVSFLGDSQVCDFMDFIALQGEERAALTAVMDYLKGLKWQTIALSALRPDSLALNYFVPLAQSRGYSVEISQIDVSPRLPLPESWEDYLLLLKGKDRHELRRKLRRLSQAGEAQCYVIENGSQLSQGIADFLHLFRQSEGDKQEFMTSQMADFFKNIATSLAGEGFLRLFFLEINGARAAAALCFDYQDEVYLYNCGYDPALSSLSPGLLLKALCLKEGILKGKKCFHFLRGWEPYKYDLGGQDMPIYRCVISRK